MASKRKKYDEVSWKELVAQVEELTLWVKYFRAKAGIPAPLKGKRPWGNKLPNGSAPPKFP